MCIFVFTFFSILLYSAWADQNDADNYDRRPALNISDTTASLNRQRPAFRGPDLAWYGPPPAPASDDVWKRFVCKGTKMLAQMSYSDFDVGQLLPNPRPTVQSRWSKDDLATWGYKFIKHGAEAYCDFSEGQYWGIDKMLRKLHYSDKCVEDGGRLRAGVIAHYDPLDADTPQDKQTYTDPYGKVRRVTGGFFHMAIDPGATIMAQNLESPWEALQQLHPWDFESAELPPLQRMSDMIWAMWEEWTPEDQRHDIESFWSLSIANDVTNSIIRRAMDDADKELDWVGNVFSTDTDEGKAMLGSPNGAAFAHFLIERKAQVGLKTIDSILVFECPNEARSACLLFTVKPLDKPTPRPKDDGPVPGPRPDDPNIWENSKNPWKDHLFPPPRQRRADDERNIVREHVFRLDAIGNLTWTISYK